MPDDENPASENKSARRWLHRRSPEQPQIQVGDRVCYSKKFLQSTGQYTGRVPFARGEVTAIIPLGDAQLAEVDWSDDKLPKQVHVANLSRVTKKGVQELP